LNIDTRCGFVAVVGRPNAGKSSLLNWLVGEKLAMVSHKQNATRKRMNIIVMHKIDDEPKEAQIVFVDTPGLHESEKLLNKFMLDEALKAIGDCDLILFLSPITDGTNYYEEFLEKNKKKTKHIVVLTKTDFLTPGEILTKINQFKKFDEYYEKIVPISIKKGKKQNNILDEVVSLLPYENYLFDTQITTTDHLRDIYKELIRESIFENLSDEIPYETDVLIKSVKEKPNIDIIEAWIVVEKTSQKGMLIGKKATTIKRVGQTARKKLELLCEKKVYLQLDVVVKKGWTKKEESLKQMGYV